MRESGRLGTQGGAGMTDAEYRAKRQQEINDKNALFDKVATIQNRAMKTALMECPKELAGIRTPEICMECGNKACFEAWQDQNELWPEKYEPPVSTSSVATSEKKQAKQNEISFRQKNSVIV